MARRQGGQDRKPARRSGGRGWWRRPWWRSRRLRVEMLLVRLPLALVAIGLLAHIALREPPPKPRRTDAVTAALSGEVVRAGTGEVLSLNPSPRLSLPSPSLGNRKLSFAAELARLPPPPPLGAPAPPLAAPAPLAPAPLAPAAAAPAPPAPASTVGDELVLVQPPAVPSARPLARVPPASGRGTLAVVIDDVGLNQGGRARRSACRRP